MLNFMRSHLGKTFLAVLVVAIGLVFAISGVFPTVGGVGGAEVASVGGETISIQEYQNAIERDLDRYRALGMDLPKEIVENVKMGALNTLVSQRLMLVEARRLGISTSDTEIMNEIQRIPDFQDPATKQFNSETYRKVLTANGWSPGKFEENIRHSLINQRMAQFLEARIRITPGELEREYKIANEARDLLFVRFSREGAIKKMHIDPKSVDAFLADTNKKDAIASYYAQNNMRYNKPESVCARHILKRENPAEAKKDSGNPPKAFLDLHPTVASFASLAKAHSEDPGTKDKGGDLGCFNKGMMDKAFEDAAFALPIGQVSKPVHSQFGWHYIAVYKKNPAVNLPLSKVQREIAEELLKLEHSDELRKINLELAQEAVKKWPAKDAETTGMFNSLEGFIPKIGRADEILKAAFDPSAKIQTGPQVFEAQGGVIVASVKSRKNADMSKLSKERENQEKILRERKMRAFYPAWIEDVKSRVKISFNAKILQQL